MASLVVSLGSIVVGVVSKWMQQVTMVITAAEGSGASLSSRLLGSVGESSDFTASERRFVALRRAKKAAEPGQGAEPEPELSPQANAGAAGASRSTVGLNPSRASRPRSLVEAPAAEEPLLAGNSRPASPGVPAELNGAE